MAQQQTAWTRQQVEERFERATGETADPTATSTDLWVWANEAIEAQRRREEAAREVGRRMRAAAEAVRRAAHR